MPDTDTALTFFPLSRETISLLTYFGKSQVGLVFFSFYLCGNRQFAKGDTKNSTL